MPKAIQAGQTYFDTEITTFSHQPPPRNVPTNYFRAAGVLKYRSIMLAGAIGALHIFVAAFWLFGAEDALVDVWLNFKQPTVSAGYLEAWQNTGFRSVRLSGRDPSLPVYCLYFSYTTPQGPYQGRAYVNGLKSIPGFWGAQKEYLGFVKLEEPFPVEVEYLSSQPSWSRIVGTRFAHLEKPLFGFLCLSPLPALGCFVYGFIHYRRRKRLLVEGLYGQGHVLEVRQSRFSLVEKKFKALVAFTDWNGTSQKISLSGLSAKQAERCRAGIASSEIFDLLYLPDCSTITLLALW